MANVVSVFHSFSSFCISHTTKMIQPPQLRFPLITGGNMVNPTSPNDPIFFLHHANVDRLWTMWQDYHGHATVTSYSVPTHYEGRRLDTPMPFHGNNDIWSFRNDNGNFPTPRQVLSNSGDILRVRYIQDQMIPNHRPNRRWFSSRSRFSTGCTRRQRYLAPLSLEEEDVDDKDAILFGGKTMTKFFPSLHQPQQRLGHHQVLPNLRGAIRNKESSSTITTSMDNVILFRDDDDDQEDTTMYFEQNNFSSSSPSSVCQNLNTFSNESERDQWNALCTDFLQQRMRQPETVSTGMTTTTTTATMTTTSYFGKQIISEMVANVTGIMALQECADMGHPANAKEDWMVMMQLSNERVAVMDCFHIPDVWEEELVRK
jgi:hypothetical protein